MSKLCDGVFEGGGMLGLAYIGAIRAIQDHGYTFQNVAGTSVGAMMAALAAAGYTADEMEAAIDAVNLEKFKGKGICDRLGFPGMLIEFLKSKGLYHTNYVEKWLGDLLEKKGVKTFGDLKLSQPTDKIKYKLQVIASDVTDGRMLVFPGALTSFGLIPDSFSVAKAVCMSISIPLFYEPYILRDAQDNKHLIVDGGLLSNYPLWLLNRKPNPTYPTFGFKFMSSFAEETLTVKYKNTHSMRGYLNAIVTTLTNPNDKYHISKSKGDFQCTIGISACLELRGQKKRADALNFSMPREEREALMGNGEKAVNDFLQSWDFPSWKTAFRNDATKAILV